MTTPVQDLQQIKGIGEILAKRFYEAGINSFVAITKAGDAGHKDLRKGLKKARKSLLRALP